MGFFGKKKDTKGSQQEYASQYRSSRVTSGSGVRSKRAPLLENPSVFEFQRRSELELQRKVQSVHDSYNRANEENRDDEPKWDRYSEKVSPRDFGNLHIEGSRNQSLAGGYSAENNYNQTNPIESNNTQNVTGRGKAVDTYSVTGEGLGADDRQNETKTMESNFPQSQKEGYDEEDAYNETNADTNLPSSTSDEIAVAAMRDGALPNPQSIVVAQLIQWKFAAEQGSVGLRVPAVIGSVGLMITTVASFLLSIGDGSSFSQVMSPSHVICAFITFMMAVLICIIDGRTRYARDPLGCRAMLRNVMTRHLNVLKLVWGRGLLYGVAGMLSIALENYYSYVSGGLMVVLGITAFFIGSRASKQLRTLRRAMSDEEYLMELFMRYDSNNDGMLNRTDFAQFILDLGLEFDDLYTLKAFSTIDLDNDQRVEFRDFVRWWSQIRLEEINNIN